MNEARRTLRRGRLPKNEAEVGRHCQEGGARSLNLVEAIDGSGLATQPV